jgi:hypothetical protein
MANISATTAAIFTVAVLVAGGLLGAYYQSTISTSNNRAQTISMLQSSVSSLQNHPVVSTTTFTSTTTQLVTSSSTRTTTNASQRTISLIASYPFASDEQPVFMVPPPIANSTGSVVSFSPDANLAILFSCPDMATTGSCQDHFNSTANVVATSITISYPEYGKSLNETGGPVGEQSWANCIYDAYVTPPSTTESILNTQGFGYCAQVAPGIFVIAEPIEPA